MTRYNLLDFKVIGDERGKLVALEEKNDIPFDVKRVYYIFSTAQGESRGHHAHKSLTQLAVCINGSCVMVMDDGIEKEEFILDSPGKGILIEPMQWHEMHSFSSDCVLLVIASDYYQESDYIRSYEEFKRLTK
ncbi:FdtA/QdtA family cupin domain-containing protein [Photobacterium sagamiensis]|uniref:sugar 3,4-ketoisomerase n=1 Tax=Photobacterium sagamiensis TaxID=2910241 RepID=UPI003D0E9D5F